MTNLLERAIKPILVTATGDVLRIGKFSGDVCGESKSGMRDKLGHRRVLSVNARVVLAAAYD